MTALAAMERAYLLLDEDNRFLRERIGAAERLLREAYDAYSEFAAGREGDERLRRLTAAMEATRQFHI